MDLLGDSSKFPEEWLFNHRWGKGKKDSPTTLPNGAKITFLTVGGRTSCVVPSVQKKTGAVAGDLKDNGEGTQNADSKKNSGKGTSKKEKGAPEQQVEKAVEDVKVEKDSGKGRKRKLSIAGTGEVGANGTDEKEAGTKGRAKKSKGESASASAKASSKASTVKDDGNTPSLGRRRSGRMSK